MKYKLNQTLFIIFSIALFSCSVRAYGQSEITFNVNLKPQLEDSIFVPDRDVIEIIGNTYPLRMSQGLTMKDYAPVDSIYSVTIDFPGRHTGDRLSFNYVIKTEQKTMTESMPRQLQLKNGEYDLEAMYFNSFAW